MVGPGGGWRGTTLLYAPASQVLAVEDGGVNGGAEPCAEEWDRSEIRDEAVGVES